MPDRYDERRQRVAAVKETREREKELKAIERRAWIEAEAKKLPRVPEYIYTEILDMLATEDGSLKPPQKTAELLGLIAILAEKGWAFPHREVVAHAINSSVHTIDRSLSTQQARGRIKQEVVTFPGNIAATDSVMHGRVFIPSKQLQRLVADARARRHPK